MFSGVAIGLDDDPAMSRHQELPDKGIETYVRWGVTDSEIKHLALCDQMIQRLHQFGYSGAEIPKVYVELQIQISRLLH